MLYPNKINRAAYESIVKAMGDDVQIKEDDKRVFAHKSKFYDGFNMHAVAVFYRKHMESHKFIPSIHVILSTVDGQVSDENIFVGSYDEIATIKHRIQEHLSV